MNNLRSKGAKSHRGAQALTLLAYLCHTCMYIDEYLSLSRVKHLLIEVCVCVCVSVQILSLCS